MYVHGFKLTPGVLVRVVVVIMVVLVRAENFFFIFENFPQLYKNTKTSEKSLLGSFFDVLEVTFLLQL